MGYIKTYLTFAISFSERDFENKVLPKLEKIYEEQPEEEWESLKEYCEEEHSIVWNYGYYHSEYSIGVYLEEEDSDIRSLQDFNYSFDIYSKKKLYKIANENEILNLLGIKPEELNLTVMVYNY